MKRYQFIDVPYIKKGQMITVTFEDQESIGFIKKEVISGCEKERAFSFSAYDGSPVVMGIKQRYLKPFVDATYLITTKEKNLVLKDQGRHKLPDFCVEGTIDSENIHIKENSNSIDVRFGNNHIATVKSNNVTRKTTVLIDDSICNSSVLFAVIVLMNFMYKIYINESKFIENIFLKPW